MDCLLLMYCFTPEERRQGVPNVSLPQPHWIDLTLQSSLPIWRLLNTETVAFQHMLKRKKHPAPKPLSHLIQLEKGFLAFLTLSASHQKSSCWAATEHITKPQLAHRYTQEDSSRSQKPHQRISLGTQPASQLTLISTSKNPSLVQFLRQPKSVLPNQPHTAQSCCATGHTTISGKSHMNQWQAKGCPSREAGRKISILVSFERGERER